VVHLPTPVAEQRVRLLVRKTTGQVPKIAALDLFGN